MRAELNTRDLPECLEYRVTQLHSRTHLLLRTAAWIAAFFFPISMARESPLFALGLAGILIYSSIVDVQRARRGTNVCFTVTKRDIISDGFTQHEYYPLNRWRVQAPDLSWRETRSSEDGPTYPQGVYCGNDCVLPLVTMEEGQSIITAIYRRYPDTASDSSYDTSSVPSSIITLGLSKQ